jgi:alanyl-tRNA synthetase
MSEPVQPPVETPPVPPPAPPPDDTEARINAAAAAAAKRAKAEAEKEFSETRKRLAAYEQKELEAKGQYADALKSQADSIRAEYEPKLKEYDEKVSTLTGVVRDRTVGLVLVNAAASGNANNPKEIAKLLDGYVRLNDAYDTTVVDDHGQQRFVAGKPMTPEQLVAEYLTTNPWHVKAANTGAGGGAGRGASGLAPEAGEIARLEKAIADVADKVRRNRNNVDAVTEHRRLSNELKAKRAAAA